MKKVTLSLIIVIIVILTIFAYAELVFNTGHISLNTFYSDENITSYIHIPKSAYINNITLRFTGINLSNSLYNSSFRCFEEFANGTSRCGASPSGNYSNVSDGSTFFGGLHIAGSQWNNMHYCHDGRWDTFCTDSADGNDFSYMRVNYTKPVGAENTSQWKVKSGAGILYLNFTAGCWDTHSDKMELLFHSRDAGSDTVTYYCNDAGSWTQLHQFSGTVQHYEEALIWHNASVSTLYDVYVEVGSTDNNPEFNFTGYYNESRDVSLDTSFLNELLGADCNCTGCVISMHHCSVPIISHSNSAGLINITLTNYTYSYGIDNCSDSYNIPDNSTSLFINFKDLEEMDALIDYAATLQYSPYDENYSYYSLEIDEIYNTTYCIYPSWANISGDLQIEYTDIDGDVLNYFTSGTEFTNMTQNLTLYVQNGTTEVLFTVLDNDGNEVADAHIHILRYDVGTGTYTTTEVIKTDSNGQGIGNIVLISDFYNFLIYYESELVYSELGVKIISTTRTFTVNLYGTTWHDNYKNTLGVNTNLYFNDATQNWVYIWSDPTASMHYGCLRVDLRNDSGMYNLTDKCEYTTSGTIIYNIPVLQNGTTYIATGYLKYDDIQITDVAQKVIEATRDYSEQNPMGALLLAFCAIVVLFTIGIPNPSLAITLMGAGVLFSAILGFYAISSLATGSIIVLILVQLYIAGRQQT